MNHRNRYLSSKVVIRGSPLLECLALMRSANTKRTPRKLVSYFVLCALLSWLILPVDVSQQRVLAKQNQPASDKQPSETDMKNMSANSPLFFEANQGQLDSRVKFSARGSGYKLFLTSTEAVYVIPERKAIEGQTPTSKFDFHSREESKSSRAVAVWMKLSGANQNAEADGVDELEGKHNYFIGNDQCKWRSNVPLYQRARFANVYQGVDIEWHGNEAGSIEYDFKVSPFVSTQQIEWQIDGADKVRVDADGSLVISTPFGELRQNAPVTYQESNGVKSSIQSRFELRGENTFGFTVGEYDQSKPLTIDPATDLKYSTFLGGESDEIGFAITSGNNNTVYVTGNTSSISFPTTAGVFNINNNGGYDVFVSKLDTRGGEPLYSTYIGGDGNEVGLAIAVDSSGDAYITGETSNSMTPYPTTASAPFPNNSGGDDAFVTKLNATGSALIFSTFLGGVGFDQCNGIAVLSGEVYVVGLTESSDFPTTPGAFDTSFNGFRDIFVTKLSGNGASLNYSTLIGGSGNDVGRGIVVDNGGNVFICGNSEYSSNYPVSLGAFQSTNHGAVDGVLTKLNDNGSGIVYSTFIGADGYDFTSAIAIDQSGRAYITGSTDNTTLSFPTTPGVFDRTPNGPSDVFVTKFNAEGTALVYSTLIGGDGFEDVGGIAVNDTGNAFVTGLTGFVTFPYPTTTGAFDTTPNGNFDVFLTKLSPTGAALNYSTLIGGNGVEYGLGIALDSLGDAFLVGYTTDASVDFPTTANALQPQINGSSDAFVCKFLATSDVRIPRPQFDYDGDGKSDVSVFRPSSNIWHLLRSQLGYVGVAFGQGGDQLTPANFDGDGRTDVAIFRPSNGTWYRYNSSDGTFYYEQFGANGDVAVPADFDGDGKDDLAVFRPSVAVWYWKNSGNGVVTGMQFGAPGDKPAVGDFDGDGKADVSVFRPSNGGWYRLNSSNGSVSSAAFGISEDKPTPADYDGDGKTDISVYRPSTGGWYRLNSSNGSFTAIAFGTAGDKPAAADYDGDGKADIAVFRPSTGYWYLLSSINGAVTYQLFGISEDLPTPNAFVY